MKRYVMKVALIWLALGMVLSGCGGGGGPQPPASPSSLTAEAVSSGTIHLSWTDNSDNESGFEIERSTAGDGGFSQVGTVGAGMTSFDNTGLAADTTYYYRVRAHNDAGNSPYTNTASATTPAAGSIPAAPSGLAAQDFAPDSIRMVWTDNSDNETGFKIERSTSSTGGFTEIHITAADVTAYDNTGLAAGTTYYYRVRAYNAAGNSAYSNTVSATTPPPAPAAPSGLIATALSAGSIRLAWTDNAANETGFRIERSTSSTGGFTQIATTVANVTTYDNTGLSDNTTYYYRVRSYNGGGNSSYCATASATTPPAPLAAPSGLTATALSVSSIRLAWTDNAGNETGFKIERSTSSTGGFTQIATTAVNVTTYDNTGLSANTTYYYRVRSYNGGGNSSYCATASATTPPAPLAAPSGLTATALSASSIHLAWTDNAGNETGFKIERSASSTGGFTQIAATAANVTTHDNTGLSANTTYYYRVRSYNGGGNSSYSNTASAGTPASNAPVLSGPGTATGLFQMTWTYTWPGLAGTSDHYELEYSYTSASGYQVIVSTPLGVRTSPYTAPIQPEAIDIGKTSYFRVRARNASGYTAYSNIVAVSIPYIDGTFNPSCDNRLVTSDVFPGWGNTVYASGDLGVGLDYTGGVYVDTYMYTMSALKFDIMNVISGGTIQKAVLRFCPQVLPGTFTADYAVRPFSANWNTATITFNNCPSVYTGSAYTSVEPAPLTTAVPWEFDVTNIVRAWANGTIPNYGFLLFEYNMTFPPLGTTELRGVPIYGSEQGSGVRPELYIEIR